MINTWIQSVPSRHLAAGNATRRARFHMLSLKFGINCLSLKDVAWKHTTYQGNKSDIGHTCLKQKSMKNTQIALISPFRSTDKKEKKERQLQSVSHYTKTQLEEITNLWEEKLEERPLCEDLH